MASFSPDTIIIGAQKSGTTTLAKLLEQNPSICLSDPKEPNYFSVNHEQGEQWYKERFSALSQILVEASTTYTMLPLSEESLKLKPGRDKLTGVAERIHQANPNVKLIYIIREPVARMYSNYWHNIKYSYENKSFNEAIQYDSLYYEMSCYFAQLSEYLKYFSKENILLIKFEDLIKDQLRILNLCEQFIGVDKTASTGEIKNENKGGQYNDMAKLLIKNPLVNFIEANLPKRLKRLLKKAFTKKIPELSATRKEELMQHFLEDQKRLQKEFGVSYLAK